MQKTAMTMDSVALALAKSGAGLRAANVVSVTFRTLPRDRIWIGVEPGEPDLDGMGTEVAVAAVTLALEQLAPEPPFSVEIGHIEKRGSMMLAWPPRAMIQGVRRQLDRLEEELRHLEDLEHVDRHSRHPSSSGGAS